MAARFLIMTEFRWSSSLSLELCLLLGLGLDLHWGLGPEPELDLDLVLLEDFDFDLVDLEPERVRALDDLESDLDLDLLSDDFEGLESDPLGESFSLLLALFPEFLFFLPRVLALPVAFLFSIFFPLLGSSRSVTSWAWMSNSSDVGALARETLVALRFSMAQRKMSNS